VLSGEAYLLRTQHWVRLETGVRLGYRNGSVLIMRKEKPMPQRVRAQPNGSAALMALIILAGIALAVANVAVFLLTTDRPSGSTELLSLAERYSLCPACFIYLTAAPVVFTILLAFLVGRRPAAAAATTIAAVQPAPGGPPSPAPALRLLALLQQDGRFLDFIAEDIDGYSDEQIGGAVRSIHAGCRKALQERVEVQRILADEDGSTVVVDKGFDPATVRLTGNVAGGPPFRGVLQHGGWRVTKVALPESPGGVDPHIIAPAEVEIA
jgi:hypothetical protein